MLGEMACDGGDADDGPGHEEERGWKRGRVVVDIYCIGGGREETRAMCGNRHNTERKTRMPMAGDDNGDHSETLK